MDFYKLNPELKKNISDFSYGINYKYEGMLAYSFDRFYAVTNFILPSVRGLTFLKLKYDNTCIYLDNKNIRNAETKKHILDVITFLQKD